MLSFFLFNASGNPASSPYDPNVSLEQAFPSANREQEMGAVDQRGEQLPAAPMDSQENIGNAEKTMDQGGPEITVDRVDSAQASADKTTGVEDTSDPVPANSEPTHVEGAADKVSTEEAERSPKEESKGCCCTVS